MRSMVEQVRWWRVRHATRGGRMWISSLVLLAIAVGAAFLLPLVDAQLGARTAGWPKLNNAVVVNILTVVAGGMITLAGLVFTAITLAMQIGVSSLSVRIIPLFQNDHVMRWSLATFISAFGYSLFLAFAIGSAQEPFSPVISTVVAGGFVVLGGICLIAVVERVMNRLNPAKVCDTMAEIGHRSLHGRVATFRRRQPPMPMRQPEDDDAVVALERRPSAGDALLAVHTARVRSLERRHGVKIELLAGFGETLTSRTPIFAITRNGAPAQDEAVELRQHLLRCLAIGDAYSPRNGPTGAIRTLVDIALKALSPSINDPSRAVQVLDVLKELLVEIADHLINDEQRPVHRAREWRHYVSLATDEIRQYGATSVQIHRRLRALFGALLETLPDALHAPLEARLDALDDSLELQWPLSIDQRLAAEEDPMGIGSPES